MFQDLANVLYIRDALWRYGSIGKASIMVGAGFSRNADQVTSHSKPMPTWEEVAQSLCSPLYPHDEAGFKYALKRSAGTSGFLRLAQEYQVAFGKSDLNAKIKSVVPDDEYNPSDIHKRLLSLPWSDVFTTNWDTLLERGAKEVINRSYDIVRTISDIPQSKQPRVVKLHGTFPSHEPFIFTEEDYRNYPSNFAPFVNLVQQAMTENIFCLIGFSGDDPNFLHWAGWVRDHLGKHAPKIYLVGYLELSIHQRRMLEDRNIMPIDLALLPADTLRDWPESKRHKLSTEWFINTLEIGKPFEKLKWPSTVRQSNSIPPILGKLPELVSVGPLVEYSMLNNGQNEDQSGKLQALQREIDVWEHNRKLYPGWIVAPSHIRAQIWHKTNDWLANYNNLWKNLPLDQQICGFYELNWRLQLCLVPLISPFRDNLIEFIESIKDEYLTGQQTINQEKEQKLRKIQSLVIALIKCFRQEGDIVRFEQFLAYKEKFVSHFPEYYNDYEYEKCLYLLSYKTQAELKAALIAWNLENDDPLYLMRKAGMYAEINEDGMAIQILEPLINKIRTNRNKQTDDISSYSLEGWALQLAKTYSNSFFYAQKNNVLKDSVDTYYTRLKDLRAYDCDTNIDLEDISNLLSVAPKNYNGMTSNKSFDLNRENNTYHFGSGFPDNILAAYQTIVLSETTGLPPSANNFTILGKSIQKACENLIGEDDWLVTQQALRLNTSDSERIIDKLFSRANVAVMTPDSVSKIYNILMQKVEFGIGYFQANPAPANARLLTPYIELLSRVSLRLNPGHLKQLLQLAFKLISNIEIKQWIHLFNKPLHNLFKRTTEALPVENLKEFVTQFFDCKYLANSPSDQIQDPIFCFPEGAIEQLDISKSQLKLLVTLLDGYATGEDASLRKGAIHRLNLLFERKLLNKKESARFFELLWDNSQLDSVGLPKDTYFRKASFLEINNNGEQAFHSMKEYIRVFFESETIEINSLEEVSLVLSQAAKLEIDLQLTASNVIKINRALKSWTELKIHNAKNDPFFGFASNSYEDAIDIILNLLPSNLITEDTLVSISEHINRMLDNSIYVTRLLVLDIDISKKLNHSHKFETSKVRKAFLSHDRSEARVGAFAIFHIISKLESGVLKVKEDDARNLLNDIGIAIVNRRSEILSDSLIIAEHIFNSNSIDNQRLLADNCVLGLKLLFDETEYLAGKENLYIPDLRYNCSKLALAMSKSKLVEKNEIQNWLDRIDNDPLPDVRHLLDGGIKT